MASDLDGVERSHLVVGLGNPGPRYSQTRHNVGFRVADLIAGRWEASPWEPRCASLVCRIRLGARTVVLAKPQTFMNRSGEAVALLKLETGVEIARVVVVHDDLDLAFGRIRIRTKGGHGGHNGIRSLIDVLATGDFVRVKLGIGRPEEGDDVVRHVLSPFSRDQDAVLSGFLARAADAVESIIVEGPERAMNSFAS